MTELHDLVVTLGAKNEPQFEASFPADRAAISRVRRQLRACLEEDGLEHVADDVTLICTELMTNAILHGCVNLPHRAKVKITVAWSDDQLRVDMRDPSAVKPTEQRLSVSRTSGRGLCLVDELSDRWGVETDPGGSGKTVWTELDSPRRRAS
ncbi:MULTISPECIES: ATP-binding protein [Streptomyces]|uniref:ATP-binding protein n=1 Tax=Streptomyces TaxID=1883 RepID=UPI000689997C|nr:MULTISPECIES: ATP-binding protein [Streptomyces]MDX3275241.1 ATP-binding protein [Streptomyces scabiei]MDX3846994.1 ATP-binding protein [Streptomyces europaeiscabiei]